MPLLADVQLLPELRVESWLRWLTDQLERKQLRVSAWNAAARVLRCQRVLWMLLHQVLRFQVCLAFCVRSR